MNFFGAGISIGRYFGITVRLHWLLFVVAYLWGSRYAEATGSPALAAVIIIGQFLCVLLHEFGHALMARWCDGEVDEIVLWPLGGLAFCRPLYNPTAHLLTTVAGPFVTLVLWAGFALGANALQQAGVLSHPHGATLVATCVVLAGWNKLLLLFNLIPAFPMDGGRILRDSLWHWIGARKATLIAVRVSQVMAIAALGWCVYSREFWLMLFPLFILSQAGASHRLVGAIEIPEQPFSIRERLRRPRDQSPFGQLDPEEELTPSAFHGCYICGKTDTDHPLLDFRVCTDCSDAKEYCPEHLHAHAHL